MARATWSLANASTFGPLHLGSRDEQLPPNTGGDEFTAADFAPDGLRSLVPPLREFEHVEICFGGRGFILLHEKSDSKELRSAFNYGLATIAQKNHE